MSKRSHDACCFDSDDDEPAALRKELIEVLNSVERTRQKLEPRAVGNHDIDNQFNSALSNASLLLDEQSALPLAPLPHLPPLLPIPEMAKSVGAGAFAAPNEPLASLAEQLMLATMDLQAAKLLPHARGLTNMGNTCFLNVVLQCLAQTPHLLELLKESSEPGDGFTLSDGISSLGDDKGASAPTFEGVLSSWGPLTLSLIDTLEKLQPGGTIFTPTQLFRELCTKCPQFRGGAQQDSHELLRRLLKSVGPDGVKCYDPFFQDIFDYNDQDFGNLVAERFLRPEQVFRGIFVSILTCQDCHHASSKYEDFLDLSLPVSCVAPQPARRLRSHAKDESAPFAFAATSFNGPIKAPPKTQNSAYVARMKEALQLCNVTPVDWKRGGGNAATAVEVFGGKTQFGAFASSSSLSKHAKVDVNMIDGTVTDGGDGTSRAYNCGVNGNNELPLLYPAANPEKQNGSAEDLDMLSLYDDGVDNGVGTAIRPADAGSSLPPSRTNGEGKSDDYKLAALYDDIPPFELHEDALPAHQLPHDDAFAHFNGALKEKIDSTDLAAKFAKLQIWEQEELSVELCLKNFTAVELMTGNNKVGCVNCTRRLNGGDRTAKTVNTNTTKQLLVSSAPAVLILHLNRFHQSPFYIVRKTECHVSFKLVMDIAPFCDPRNCRPTSPSHIGGKQQKLLYALYGVVEHLGGMYGGHYTAFVKIRPRMAADDKRWKFVSHCTTSELDQADEQRAKLLAMGKARELRMKAAADYSGDFSGDFSSSTFGEAEGSGAASGSPAGAVGGDEEAKHVQVPSGKWYYVSDSRVQRVSEAVVLRAQAYLLFYERIY